MVSPTLEASANGSAHLDVSKRPPSTSSRPSSSRSSDPGERLLQSPKPQLPAAGLQAKLGKKTNNAQEIRAKALEGEFKVKHLGLLGVLAWIL